MERTQTDPVAVPGAVRLYRDDLEYILSVIRMPSDKIEITEGEFKYDSLDELEKERGSELRFLRLWSCSPDWKTVTLTISNEIHGVRLSSRGRDEAFYKIRERLLKRQRLLTIIGPFAAPIGFLALVTFPAAATVWDIPNGYFAPAFFLGTLGSLSYLFHAGMFSVVYLKRRHEHRTFWDRNQGEIVKGLTSGLIGVILGYLIRMIQTGGKTP